MPRRSFGTGYVYQRGRIWWIAWRDRKGRHRESSDSEKQKLAEKLLRKRLSESDAGDPAPDVRHSTTLEVLCEMVFADYRVNGRTSLDAAERRSRHLLRLLKPETNAEHVDEAVITSHVDDRMAGGAAVATVNRELAFLRRAFRLAARARRIVRRPDIQTLTENNAPARGSWKPEQLASILPRMKDPDARLLAEVSYLTGWRVQSELQTRRRHHLDLAAGWLRLEPGETKNRKGRRFPRDRAPQRDPGGAGGPHGRARARAGPADPWLFHRKAKPIRSWRKGFTTAAIAAGLPGRIPHDFRRSACATWSAPG